MPAFLDADVLLAKLGGANSPISQLQRSIRIKGRRGVDIVQDFSVQTQVRHCWRGNPEDDGGWRQDMSNMQMKRLQRFGLLASVVWVVVGFLLASHNETWIVAWKLYCSVAADAALWRRYCLPRGPLGCGRRDCAPSPYSDLANCLGDFCRNTPVRPRCMNSKPYRGIAGQGDRGDEKPPKPTQRTTRDRLIGARIQGPKTWVVAKIPASARLQQQTSSPVGAMTGIGLDSAAFIEKRFDEGDRQRPDPQARCRGIRLYAPCCEPGTP